MTDTAGGIASAILDRFSEKRVPTENEYLGENGLLYCSKCHTPVQCRVNMLLDGELRETQTTDYFSKHRRSDCAVRELTAR